MEVLINIMKHELISNHEWIKLKARLQFVEEKIIHIMNLDGWTSDKCLYGQVKELLHNRHYIMNGMFRLHITEQEVARFRKVNDQLLKLTRDMFATHRNLMDFLSANFIETIAPSCVVQVESKLDVDEGGEILLFDDDADYGSDFSKMAEAIAWTEDLEIRFCSTYIGETPESDNLDDGTTWAEECLDIPQFKGFIVCFAVHDLCTHKNYSVPDLLRLKSYRISHTVDTCRTHSV